MVFDSERPSWRCNLLALIFFFARRSSPQSISLGISCYNRGVSSYQLHETFVSEVTQILSRIEAGDPGAAAQLLPLLYDELKKVAVHKLAEEKPGQTLQPTALVHEAYVRLVDGESSQVWNSRGHFFAAAAEAMRRILVDSARRKQRIKHGGELRRIPLEIAGPFKYENPDELLRIDEAISKLASEDPAAAELVKLRYFAGLSVEEAASALGFSRSSAYEHWIYARAWLHSEVYGDSENS
jgi:RNA polymerase sigma factor (TIGR02999 family)